MKLMTLTVLAYGRPMGIHTRQANLDKWRPRLCRAICISFGGGQGRNGGLNRGMDGRDQTVEVFGVRGLSRWRCLRLWMCVHRCRAPLGPAWWCCQIKGWGAEGLMADVRHRQSNVACVRFSGDVNTFVITVHGPLGDIAVNEKVSRRKRVSCIWIASC